MSVEAVIASYLRIARQDLDDAILLGSRSSRNAIYLCEQAAEKVIRAILSSENLRAGIGHNLDDMITQIPDANPIKQLLQGLGGLALYATAYRYPNTKDQIPKPPDATKFLAFSQKVEAALTQAVARFGVDLAHKDSPAQNPGPIR